MANAASPDDELSSVQRRPRLVGQLGKGGRIADREIGEDLPIDFNAGLLQAVDEGAVRQLVQVSTGVDAQDPEASEIALLVLAITIRVLPATLDRFLGGPPELAAGAEGAASGLHDLLLALEARDVRYGPRHEPLSLRLQQALHALHITRRGNQPRLAQTALSLG